ncbi:MAG: class I SAM-dependent methyltransferase [Gemmatimonadota bacterium]
MHGDRSRDEFTACNRAAWNEAAPVHAATELEKLQNEIGQPDFSCLDATAAHALREAGVAGSHVAQLACNNGREVLSMLTLGAASAVGFDISEGFIAQAVELAQRAGRGADCEFVVSDLYNIPTGYDRTFDVVYSSVGVLGWMPELAGFFAVAHRLLKPGGRLVIYELHPVLGMFDPDRAADPGQPVTLPSYSYFSADPFSDTTGLDYWTGTQYESSAFFWFQHTLGSIVSSCLAAGLALKSLREFGHDISRIYGRLEKAEAVPPMCFLLHAERPAS